MLTNFRVKELLSRLVSGDYQDFAKTIPFYPTISPRTATVATKTADYTVTQADLDAPTVFNNTGDTGTQTLTLPAVADSKGKVIAVSVTAAQIVRLDPQTGEAVNYFGSAVVSKYVQVAGVIGNYIELFCDGSQWIVTKGNGVITKEA